MDNLHEYPPSRKLNSVLVENILSPDLNSQIAIKTRSEANGHMCWTCGSCDTECPVNIATGRLRPQKIVRLANLGLMDQLLRLPEIWYCISCRRCLEVCPNLVKPATTIAYIRYAMADSGALPIERAIAYRELFAHFQRVRWHATAKCMKGEFTPISKTTFQDWLQSPAPALTDVITNNQLLSGSEGFRKVTFNFNTALCFTCGECSSACPVSHERSVFDARSIFRMANLGLMDDILNSPSLWLCVNCGSCSEACSQNVDGSNLIESLKQMAVKEAVVDSDFRFRLEKADKIIYSHFLDEIDRLLRLNAYRNKMH